MMKTEREKMTNAEPFLTNDPQLMEDKKNARILCSRFNDSPEDESVRKDCIRSIRCRPSGGFDFAAYDSMFSRLINTSARA